MVITKEILNKILSNNCIHHLLKRITFIKISNLLWNSNVWEFKRIRLRKMSGFVLYQKVLTLFKLKVPLMILKLKKLLNL